MYRSIQAGRAIAALLVVCFHTGGNLKKASYFGDAALTIEKITSIGDCGVPFFFVLSGFIITFIHRRDFGNPASFLPYLRKRAVRIYPAYVIVFAAVSLMAMITPGLQDVVPREPMTLIRSILLLPQDPAVVGGTGAPVLVVAWSLQYEVMFYLLMGLAIIGRWPFVFTIGALMVNLLLFLVSGSAAFPQSFFLNKLILLFALGAMVEFAAHRDGRKLPATALALVGLAGALSLAVYEIVMGRSGTEPFRVLFYGASSALLLLGLVTWEDTRGHALKGRWLPLLGDSSYALYLLHFPMVSVLCKLIAALGVRSFAGAAASFAAIVAICVLTAMLFHAFVERPVLHALGRSRRPSMGRAAALPSNRS